MLNKGKSVTRKSADIDLHFIVLRIYSSKRERKKIMNYYFIHLVPSPRRLSNHDTRLSGHA